jgi:hypothetical protein
MKAFRGWAIMAGLVVAATAANAQEVAQPAGPDGYQAASDLSGPYGDVPPAYGPPGYAPPAPAYAPPAYVAPQAVVPEYGPAAPGLLPPREVYSVLRENGFSAIGSPRLRGYFYSIAAVDRRGDDGRLLIDARNGQIVRFVPAYRLGGYRDGYGAYGGGGYDGYYEGSYGPSYGPLEPMSRRFYGPPPRPPASVPRVASRMPSAVPVPKAAPARSRDEKSVAEKPAPMQQSAAVQLKPADTPPAAAPAAASPAEVKPAAPAIQPTQPMPKVQGLE